MNKLFFSFLVAMLALGLAVSCASSDDDDSSGDDDNDDVDDDDDDDTVSGETWTDPSTGLTWQVTPSSGILTMPNAKSFCENLSLDGGGWRLPTVSELRTLIRGCDTAVTGGSCGVTDSCLTHDCQDETCLACNVGDGPNNGCYGPTELSGECEWFWSSSPVEDYKYNAWYVSFDSGNVYFASYGADDSDIVAKADANDNVRCVR